MKRNYGRSIRSLQCFESVARNQSISKAASELGVTPGAVSHQLRFLSEKLGEQLLVKSGRGVALTETGRKLALQLQTAFSTIVDSVAQVVGTQKPTVRLAMCSSFAPGWLIRRLGSFMQVNPMVDLQIQLYAQPPELTDQVADAFVTTTSGQPGFWYLHLMYEKLVAVQAPKSLSNANDGPPLPLITTDTDGSRVGEDWREYAKVSGMNLESFHDGRWFKCSHYLLALEMARSRLGTALVPDFLAERSIEAGELVTLGPSSLAVGRSYHLCIKSSRRDEHALTSLAQWFKNQIQENVNL